MAKRNNPGCRCCGSSCSSPTITGTVRGCNNLGVSGATVEAHDSTSGGTLLGSTTTNASGAYTLSGLSGAVSGNSIVIVVTSPKFTSGTRTLTYTAGAPSASQWSCGASTGSAFTNLSPAAGYVCSRCCTASAFPQPRTLFLTDSEGTYTLTFTSGVTQDFWFGCRTKSVTPTLSAGVPCVAGGADTVFIGYQVRCQSASSWAVTRQWPEAQLAGVWYYDKTATCSGSQTLTPGTCASAAVAIATQGALTLDCSAIAFSGTLTAAGTNNTADPVGGSVTVSE